VGQKIFFLVILIWLPFWDWLRAWASPLAKSRYVLAAKAHFTSTSSHVKPKYSQRYTICQGDEVDCNSFPTTCNHSLTIIHPLTHLFTDLDVSSYKICSQTFHLESTLLTSVPWDRSLHAFEHRHDYVTRTLCSNIFAASYNRYKLLRLSETRALAWALESSLEPNQTPVVYKRNVQ